MTPLMQVIERIKGSSLTAVEQAAVEQARLMDTAGPSTAPYGASELMAVAARYIEDEEGRVAHAYRDHLGYLTIGVGRLIDARRHGCLSDAEIDLLLANDIAARAAAMAGWPGWQRLQGDTVRRTALLSMSFQLGTTGLARFTTTLAHVAAGRFDAAADAMLDSLWAAQTPARAARTALMMRTGVLP